MKHTKKATKALALMISLLMLLTMIPISVSAEPSVEATAIRSFSDFAAMTEDGSYYLANDIVITATYAGTFKGTLDGNGKTVITKVPLFKSVDGATVEDLTVKGAIKDMAAVASYVSGNATFKNIINEASVDGSERTLKQDYQNVEAVTLADSATGGIAGIVVGSSAEGTTVTFENCVNKGAIKTLEPATIASVGGILGAALFNDALANGDVTFRATIVFTNCENEGKIEAIRHAGGIFGFASRVALADFEKCNNSGEIVSAVDAGGIAGKIEYSTVVKITDCHNSGSVTAAKDPAGGILGVCNGPETTTKIVTNCTNTGNITASGKGKADPAGIVGYSASTPISIINCHNSGVINGTNAAGGILTEALGGATVINCSNTASVSCSGVYAGGIVAFDNKKEVDIYYCSNTGDITTNQFGGGISGRTDNVVSDIIGCYNSGKILFNEGVTDGKLGQIFQGLNHGDLLNNYYDKALSDAGVRAYYIKGTEDDNDSEYCTPYETADVASGKLAYDMNKALGEQIYYQNLTDANVAKYPTLNTSDGVVIKSGENYYTVRITTEDKAAVRIDGAKTGLRVTTAVNKADYDKLIAAGINANDLTLGTVFTSAAYVNAVAEVGGTFTMSSLDELLTDIETAYVDVSVKKKGAEGFWATDSEAYHFRGAIVNVAKDNLDDGFSAIGYVKLGEDIVYSAYYTTVSIAEISKTAYEDRADAVDANYTQTIAANSECAIGAVVTYSPYTEAQLKTIKSYFN